MTPTLPASAPSPKKCLHCDGNTVRPRRRPGRTVHYKTTAALPLPADLMIPTCSRCRAEYLDADMAQRLEATLSTLYLAELRRRASEAIKTLRQHISQRRLELRIGLSQGYLSRLLADAGNPSPPLVLLLAQLAKDPESRLPEIERFWREIHPLHDFQRTPTHVDKSKLSRGPG